MNIFPGDDLEDFLLWNYKITAEGEKEEPDHIPNIITTGQGIVGRQHLTKSQFETLVAYFESYREEIENTLMNFDEDLDYSWAEYSEKAFEFVPSAIYVSGQIFINALKTA